MGHVHVPRGYLFLEENSGVKYPRKIRKGVHLKFTTRENEKKGGKE
jgi:hypothetical protein